VNFGNVERRYFLMNIVCASDAKGVPHLAAMLLSLAETNSREKIRVFVLCDGELPDCDQIAAMLEDYPVDLSLIPVADGFPPELPLPKGHVSRTAYARLLLDEYLPPEIKRVAYLDIDIIVRGEIKELWNCDLLGKTIGAVRDVVPYARHKTLGLPSGAPYFNSGVMVIDLVRWREMSIGRRALEFACAYPSRIQWWDQCALNLILHGDWTPLDPGWNFQTMEIAREKNQFIRFDKIRPSDRRSMRIVHFSSISKPWHYLNYHPLKREYLAYRQRTPWPLEQFPDRTRSNVARLFLHRYLPLLVSFYGRVETRLLRLRRKFTTPPFPGHDSQCDHTSHHRH
jgi:lipopolysaccharide biosynthesis glycosyltransferase